MITPVEQDAMRDLLANAALLRNAAADLPKGDCARTSPRFRLVLGALDCERAAAFIYWRAELRKKGEQAAA